MAKSEDLSFSLTMSAWSSFRFLLSIAGMERVPLVPVFPDVDEAPEAGSILKEGVKLV